MEKHISSRLQAPLHPLLLKARAEDLKGIREPSTRLYGLWVSQALFKVLAIRSSTGAFFTSRLVISTDGPPDILVPTESLPTSRTPGMEGSHMTLDTLGSV